MSTTEKITITQMPWGDGRAGSHDPVRGYLGNRSFSRQWSGLVGSPDPTDRRIVAEVEACRVRIAATPRRPAPPEKPAAPPAAVLSSGREVRRTASGMYEVQPRGDNYWVQYRTLAAAVRAGGG